MGDGTRDDGNRNDPKTDEAALSARLQHLGERLNRNAAGRPAETGPGAGPRSDASAMARGLRLSTELVAGVLVGAGIGWMIDYGLGISPWGFIVFLLLGFAAGVMNVMRVAGVGPGISSGGSSPTSASRIGASSDERDRAGPPP
jgi:ATP synthase protein I